MPVEAVLKGAAVVAGTLVVAVRDRSFSLGAAAVSRGFEVTAEAKAPFESGGTGPVLPVTRERRVCAKEDSAYLLDRGRTVSTQSLA